MRLGEVAAATGTTAKTLRFYEQAGLLPPPQRTPAGYRRYTADVIARLDFIRRSRTAGLTLAQIREILQIRDTGQAPCHHVQGLPADGLDGLDRQLADLAALRATVADLFALWARRRRTRPLQRREPPWAETPLSQVSDSGSGGDVQVGDQAAHVGHGGR